MVVGRWALTSLNPRDGQENQTTEISYLDDGTLIGQLDVSDATSTIGDQQFTISARWRIDGEHVVHSQATFSSVTNDRHGVAMSRMFTAATTADTADVFEASATHLVMVGSDGRAVRYDRLPVDSRP